MATTHETLSYAEASALVRAKAQSLASPAGAVDEVALLEALGRVLAEPIVADRAQPPFARATRDGFAGRAAEFAQGAMRVTGQLRAGETWEHGPLERGACIEIMTGAPVPAEADCVVMVEHVQHDGDQVTMLESRTISVGDNVVPAGAEAKEGCTLLAAGTRFSARGVAAAAACGYARLKVRRRPHVAILATGDELVPVEMQPQQYQIRNSNSWSLAAQVRALGGEPLLQAPVPDDADALKRAIAEAAADSDLVLLSGGVSIGKYDLVEPALAACGAEFAFTGVRIQPGKPLVFGTLHDGGLPFFGLPGNPVSTMVCFALFVGPVLAALGGEAKYELPFMQARLAAAVTGNAGLTRFLPARLRYSLEDATVEPVPWQGSGDLASTARANCFLVVPEGAGALHMSDRVSVLPAE